ncbi:metallophosphoesterase [Pollutimonas nitritireducens]|uniref:Metallophosphoesterase n=1 Tax=Pollutimonas nitritireducens TaxID=2045209 RepID=A0A2N4UK78_9BURK|nr:metallophosphoesterase [Pollutimonas nitritireducens]PLC55419.1 metallophosphoesterase [Pollutimonas nitritireducens]
MTRPAKTVRLNILSDLHLSSAGLPLPRAQADLVILAGDIARPKEALQWAGGFDKPVLYVPGNHEFYGGSLDATIQDLETHTYGTAIHILDNTEIVLEGIRFLGSTLWTDFNLYGAAAREQAIEESLAFIRDFTRIKSSLSSEKTFSPADMEALFNANLAWLDKKLGESYDGPTVVITHHSPSPKSIHPRFDGSLINNCFVSNSEHLMGADRAALWIHGHTHDSFDYHVNGTRVVCNPRGYARDGINENIAFDPELVIEVPVA